MAKKSSRIEFPDGTVFEVSPDMSSDQIKATILALRSSSGKDTRSDTNEDTGELYMKPMSPTEIWNEGSKKDRLALFIRNNFSENYWFTVKEVRDQQLQFVKRLIFGESPAIHTYLSRMHDDGYLLKRKGKYVQYRLNDLIMDEYPELQLNEMKEIMQTVFNE